MLIRKLLGGNPEPVAGSEADMPPPASPARVVVAVARPEDTLVTSLLYLDTRFHAVPLTEIPDVSGADLLVVAGHATWVVEEVRLLRSETSLPICALMWEDDSAARIETLNAGADRALSRPLSPSLLEGVLVALHRRAGGPRR